MLKIAAVLTAFCTMSALSTAQIPTKGNIFLGYSHGRVDFSAPASLPDTGGLMFSNPDNLNGWNASLEGKFAPFVGIVADLSGYYGSPSVTAQCGFVAGCTPIIERSTGRVYNVLFGPRVSVSLGKFTPFAHGLLGVGHVNESSTGAAPFSHSSTSLAYAFGGGLDYKIVRTFAWRLQADFLQDQFFNSAQNNFRLSTGIVFRF